MADIREDGSELVHFDDPEFQVQFRKNDIPEWYTFDELTIHWHDEVEFIYVIKGSVKYQLNGNMVLMREGEGIFVNARQIHLITTAGEECCLYCLMFTPMLLASFGEVLGRYVSDVINNPAIPYIMLSRSVPWQAQLLENIAQLDGLSVQIGAWKAAQAAEQAAIRTGAELKVMQLLYDIWLLLYQNMPHREEEDNETGALVAIKRMMTYIQEHYQEKITIADLCRVGNIGKTKCTELFDAYANMTPMEYVRNYRVTKAITLLKNTDLSITEIAYETGFSGASFFTETFRQIKGCRPLQVRMQQRRNAAVHTDISDSSITREKGRSE